MYAFEVWIQINDFVSDLKLILSINYCYPLPCNFPWRLCKKHFFSATFGSMFRTRRLMSLLESVTFLAGLPPSTQNAFLSARFFYSGVKRSDTTPKRKRREEVQSEGSVFTSEIVPGVGHRSSFFWQHLSTNVLHLNIILFIFNLLKEIYKNTIITATAIATAILHRGPRPHHYSHFRLCCQKQNLISKSSR